MFGTSRDWENLDPCKSQRMLGGVARESGLPGTNSCGGKVATRWGYSASFCGEVCNDGEFQGLDTFG